MLRFYSIFQPPLTSMIESALEEIEKGTIEISLMGETSCILDETMLKDVSFNPIWKSLPFDPAIYKFFPVYHVVSKWSAGKSSGEFNAAYLLNSQGRF